MINEHKLTALLAPCLIFLAGCSFLTSSIPPTFVLAPATPQTAPKATAVIEEQKTSPTASIPTSESTQDVKDQDNVVQAEIISVEVSGTSGSYQFSVGILSPDTGCEQYADWWEVLSEDGQLIYRRILLHSHVSEQPFARSGGPVQIDPDTVVWVRAHMNNTDYGPLGMVGSPNDGFIIAVLPEGFGVSLQNQPPLPSGCNF